jgi:hypothetical protein
MLTERGITYASLYFDEMNRHGECNRHLEQAHTLLNAMVKRDGFPPFVHAELMLIRKQVMDAKWALAVPDTQESDDEDL